MITVITVDDTSDLRAGDVLIKADANFSKGQFLDYEVAGSWWAGWVWFDWGQELAAKYFARKVNRKYERRQQHEQWKRRIAFLVKANPPPEGD